MGSQVSNAASVMVALRRIVRFLRLAEGDAAKHGLSAAQLFVLHSLASSPAGSLGELATRTLTDQSSVSTVVARLVKRKLVIRKAATADRRRIELRLTAAGEAAVRASPRIPQTIITAAVAALPAKRQRELVRSLDALVAGIGATGVEPRMLFEDEARSR
jgi:MarR family transcriptional regulator, lower aerobic nicotinate degradation pathway regulator